MKQAAHPPCGATLKQYRGYTEIEPAVFDRGADRDVAQRLGVIEFRGEPGADDQRTPAPAPEICCGYGVGRSVFQTLAKS
jgi:hypothetical protein